MAKHPDWSLIQPSTNTFNNWSGSPTADNPGNGTRSTGSSVINPNFSVDRGTRSYQTTPGFSKPDRAGNVLPLGYTAVFEKQKATAETHIKEIGTYFIPPPQGGPTGRWTFYVVEDSNNWQVNLPTIGFRPNPIDSTAINSAKRKATNKLLNNLKDQKVNLAQAFAEREQTMKTVSNAMQATAKALTNLRKGNFTGAAKAFGIKPPKRGQRRFNKEFANDVTNAMSNGWLALQYGWKPLLQDVYGAAETLAQASMGPENRNSIYAVASGASGRKFDEATRVVNPVPSNHQGFDETSKSLKGQLFCRTGVRYIRSSPPLSALSKVGILNPALLAWELTPYSFVVDWFYPVGNWLAGLDASAGLSFHSGYETTFWQCNRHATWTYSYVRNDGRRTAKKWVDEEHYRCEMTRTTLTSFPSAPAPKFKNPLSHSHMMSAFALLKQFKR